MLHSEKDDKRQSMLMDKKFSTTGMEIKEGFEAAMGILMSPNEQSDIQSQFDKRHSSI
jgi:hypothetical protein